MLIAQPLFTQLSFSTFKEISNYSFQESIHLFIRNEWARGPRERESTILDKYYNSHCSTSLTQLSFSTLKEISNYYFQESIHLFIRNERALGPRSLSRVFWVNIAKSKLNLLYKYCLKLIGELRKEKKFRQQYCRNSTKIGERKRKRWREKEEEFQQYCYRNSSTQIPACPVSCVLKKGNYGNAIAEIGKKRNFFFW